MVSRDRLVRLLACLVFATCAFAFVLDLFIPHNGNLAKRRSESLVLREARQVVETCRKINPTMTKANNMTISRQAIPSNRLLSAVRHAPPYHIYVDRYGNLQTGTRNPEGANAHAIHIAVEPVDQAAYLSEAQWQSICALAKTMAEQAGPSLPKITFSADIALAYGIRGSSPFELVTQQQPPAQGM